MKAEDEKVMFKLQRDILDALMVSKDKSKYVTKWKNRRFIKSLTRVIKGVQTVFNEERNFRFDVFALCMVIIGGLFLKFRL